MDMKSLKTALASKDANVRANAVLEFGRTEFGVEALPLLRKALADEYVGTVINAAQCIARLGPAALDAPAAEKSMPVGLARDNADLESQLMLAGGRVWGYSGYPNGYSSCLRAMVALGVEPDYVIEYVHAHIGLSPDDLIHSLEALAGIGTPEAIDLFDRAVTFWLPELNKGQRKKVESLRTKRK